MKRWDSILLRVFLSGLPLVIILGIFSYFYGMDIFKGPQGLVKLLYNCAGLVFAIWMLLAIYLCVRLLLSSSFRNTVLAKLTFIRERDEREVMLTGKATKTTFLTSLAILIFLFCLSCFQVSIYRVPPAKAVDGKTGRITLGVGFKLLESSKPADADKTLQKTDIFTYTGLPVTSTAVILLLIIWQIISYNYSMQRLIKNEHKVTYPA
jgi:hypothetical protein